MTDLKDIETLTAAYVNEYWRLSAYVEALEDQIRDLKKKSLQDIKRAAVRAASAKEKLKAAIEAAPQLFERPRTRLFHGVKVGLQKGKGETQIPNEEKTIELIRKHFEDQAEVLIKTEETLVKKALANLAATDLKRIGVNVIEAGDQVVVKVADSDIEKLVDALFKDEETKRAAA